MSNKLGNGRGTLQRVSGDVLRVMKLLYGERVMAGSEAQLLDDEAYAAKLVTLFFPEVEILASYFAKPLLLYGWHLLHIRTFSKSLTVWGTDLILWLIISKLTALSHTAITKVYKKHRTDAAL